MLVLFWSRIIYYNFYIIVILAKEVVSHYINTEKEISFYSPQAEKLVDSDNFKEWSEFLSKFKLIYFAIYCIKDKGNKNESFFNGQ